MTIAISLGAVWVVGFTIIVGLSIRKRNRRRREAESWKLHLEDY